MNETTAIQPPDEPCTETTLSPEFIDAPARFVEPQNEFRLIPVLREAAQLRNPSEALVRAAAAFYRSQHATTPTEAQEEAELGNALADLAVSGREMYRHFGSPQTFEPTLTDTTRDFFALSSITATPEEVSAALTPALDRAYAVAWALRGPAEQRAALRAPLGWIAVSGEDDKPHRPVNVPGAPYEQYEIVVVRGPATPKELIVRTRFFIASPPTGVAAAPITPAARALPPDPVPVVPDGHEVILFIHGHSSGAEEALTIIPHIHRAGLAVGRKFSVISLDLPNNGYCESFEHSAVAPSQDTTYPGGLFDHTPINTPIIDFIEQFIVDFVNVLDKITPIKDRFAGVIGGSLGGNMGLRLGRRSLREHPWLRGGIVSWNAASVWSPMINDELKRHGPERCQNHWDKWEEPSTRAEYFSEVFDQKVLPPIIDHTQPELWYRDGWECKKIHIDGARSARREIYCKDFRQWHWRVAGEQLIYSHVDRVDHEDPASPYRYTLNQVSHLLVGSAGDNYAGSNIFDATRMLASLMGRTPGRSLFLLNTGHSVHFERPSFFADEIVDFLTATPMSMQITGVQREELGGSRRTRIGRIRSISGTNESRGVPFEMSVDECVLALVRGSTFFVLNAAGGRTAVRLVSGRTRKYIRTVHDGTRGNNLNSLPG